MSLLIEFLLVDSTSLSLNSPINTLSYDKLNKQNQNHSKFNYDERTHRNMNINNFSIVEFTKQILEKDKLLKSENKNGYLKENVGYDNDIDKEYNYSNLKNRDIHTRISNLEKISQKDKQTLHDASYQNNQLRINFLENTIKEKEKNVIDILEQNKNLHLEKENVYSLISQEKKKNLELQRELSRYKDTLGENEELKYKLLKLTDDYNVMSNKYNRSEHIRYQQAQIIHSLQREIDLIRNGNIQKVIEHKNFQSGNFESTYQFQNNNHINDDNTEKKIKDKKPKPKKKKKPSIEKCLENPKSDKKKAIKRLKSKKHV